MLVIFIVVSRCTIPLTSSVQVHFCNLENFSDIASLLGRDKVFAVKKRVAGYLELCIGSSEEIK